MEEKTVTTTTETETNKETKKDKSKNKQNDKTNAKKLLKIKLGLFFVISMGGIVILIIFLITAIMLIGTKEIANGYQHKIARLTNSLSVTLVETMKIDISDNNFEHTRKMMTTYLRDNILLYTYIEKINSENGEPEIFIGGRPGENEFKNYNENSKKIGDYVIHIGTKKNTGETNFDSMAQLFSSEFGKQVINCAVIFLLFGIFASLSIAKIISETLDKLSNAAKQIADGNFDVKLEETNFIEINDMINSYNEMGGQLNELYNSLEQKVQERTNALEEANEKLKETQAMMVHSEKMRSLGELVAGIAHEINNPVNFIHGNIMILQNYADDLISLIDEFSEHEDELKPDEKEKIEKIKKDIDLDFLRGDIKDLIKSCIEGTQRTKNIVLDLKNFSRMEEMVLTQFDIPKEIDTTLNILNNKYKNRITVVKNYSPDAPKIEAYGGQLNQVFMNILDNAQDAIQGQGTVTINVDKVGENVKIEFIDTGAGIPEENLKKVFDPFFTTKAVGKGTGLGMSISYRVINDHNGTINVTSKVGEGTKFTIILPINHVSKEEKAKEEKA